MIRDRLAAYFHDAVDECDWHVAGHTPSCVRAADDLLAAGVVADPDQLAVVEAERDEARAAVAAGLARVDDLNRRYLVWQGPLDHTAVADDIATIRAALAAVTDPRADAEARIREQIATDIEALPPDKWGTGWTPMAIDAYHLAIEEAAEAARIARGVREATTHGDEEKP